MLHVNMQSVNKWFDDLHVLRDITLEIERGERVVICGPSGSGKSTLIRCINGLESYQSGKIVVEGIELTDDIKNVEAVRLRYNLTTLSGHSTTGVGGSSDAATCAGPAVSHYAHLYTMAAVKRGPATITARMPPARGSFAKAGSPATRPRGWRSCGGMSAAA